MVRELSSRRGVAARRWHCRWMFWIIQITAINLTPLKRVIGLSRNGSLPGSGIALRQNPKQVANV
jgi:hypothetical protein